LKNNKGKKMITYITAFIFYTLAMIGVLLGGFVLYKKTLAPMIKNENKGLIKVVDTYSIAPKKNLMIVKIKNELFLLALDAERTTFLTKLNTEISTKQVKPSHKAVLENISELDEDIEKEIQNAFQEKNTRYDDTLKSRNDEIQKQFMELYNQDEAKVQPMQTEELSKRRQMIRHLISELNNSQTTGSKS